MATLFDMVLLIGEFLSQDFVSSTATGGSTTTLVDTKRTERDEMWNGGTILFKEGANAGRAQVIKNYSLATGTFTFDVLPAAVSAIDYALIGPDYPMAELKRGINQALLRIGGVLRYDDSLLVVDGQKIYTLPRGVSEDVKRVEVDGYSTAPHYTYRHYFWEVINRKLIFDEGSEPDGDYRIRLFYNRPIDSLVMDTDELEADVPRKAWYTGGVYYCLKARLKNTRQSDSIILALLSEAERDWRSALRDIKRMPRDPHLIFWGDYDY